MTAVEYLSYAWSVHGIIYQADIDEALKMEKEQIIEFAKDCIHKDDCFFIVEQYYNETYKQQEQ